MQRNWRFLIAIKQVGYRAQPAAYESAFERGCFHDTHDSDSVSAC